MSSFRNDFVDDEPALTKEEHDWIVEQRGRSVTDDPPGRHAKNVSHPYGDGVSGLRRKAKAE